MKIQTLALSAALWMGTSVFAGPITYTAVLNGANQNPANASPATGFATVIFDTTAHTLSIDVTFADLSAPVRYAIRQGVQRRFMSEIEDLVFVQVQSLDQVAENVWH